jgi:ABC-type transport system substrate-binding protein
VVRQPSGVDSLRRHLGSSTPLAENRFSGDNRSRYQNAELDSLIQRYLSTIPVDERLTYAARIVQHMTDQVTVLTMFYDVVPTMVSNRLINIVLPSDPPWDAHLWDLR